MSPAYKQMGDLSKKVQKSKWVDEKRREPKMDPSGEPVATGRVEEEEPSIATHVSCCEATLTSYLSHLLLQLSPKAGNVVECF